MSESSTNPSVTGGLSEERIAEYWKRGFVVVPGLVGQRELERYVQRLEAIVSGDVPPADGMLVMRDVMVAKGAVEPSTKMAGIAKIQDFEKDPELYSYALEPALLDCVESLIGRDLLSIHTMLINKPPGVDGRHPLHGISSTFRSARPARSSRAGRRSTRAAKTTVVCSRSPEATRESYVSTGSRAGNT